MHPDRRPLGLCFAALGLALSACSSGSGPATNPQPTGVGAAANQPTMVAGVMPTAGMIASGQATRPADEATPAPRPTSPMGVQRAVPISEAFKAVTTYKLLEPKKLPADYHRDLIHLIEAPVGKPDPSLPKVRMIYTGDTGTLVILQGIATGEAGEGEPVDIGTHKGWYTAAASADGTPILVWEQDGTRLEMRGKNVTKDAMLAAAAGMGPVQGG
jgi:hypothetical protein